MEELIMGLFVILVVGIPAAIAFIILCLIFGWTIDFGLIVLIAFLVGCIGAGLAVL